MTWGFSLSRLRLDTVLANSAVIRLPHAVSLRVWEEEFCALARVEAPRRTGHEPPGAREQPRTAACAAPRVTSGPCVAVPHGHAPGRGAQFLPGGHALAAAAGGGASLVRSSLAYRAMRPMSCVYARCVRPCAHDNVIRVYPPGVHPALASKEIGLLLFQPLPSGDRRPHALTLKGPTPPPAPTRRPPPARPRQRPRLPAGTSALASSPPSGAP
mmetsp:Transcript_33983/g.112473  ORF Transcript_33983/g.112473 Transcript_33983/m.112473 type:complete len:214 (-) Transcript_33983:1017-1658(-)